MKKCLCDDWLENIEHVEASIVLQALRTGTSGYSGKFFDYCPWCSLKLIDSNPLLSRRD